MTLAACAIIVAALAVAAYASSFSGSFVWDDDILITGNTYLKSAQHIPKLFIRNMGAALGIDYSFYRPLQMLTYMGDYAFWRLDARGYHLTNILLHAVAAVMVFWLISLIAADTLIAFFAAALFAVHPLHTEAVAYISGRADPLVLVFMLLSFILYLKLEKKPGALLFIAMSASYGAALLSRENALVLPFLILLYHAAFKKPLQAKRFAPIGCLWLLYAAARLTVLKHLTGDTSMSATFSDRLAGFFVAFAKYLKLFIVPTHLHMEYGPPRFSFSDTRAIAGAILLAVFIVAAYRKWKTDRLLFFGIGWFLIALVPVSNLYPINAYMAEHWLYLPSIGLFLVVAALAVRLAKKRNLAVIAYVLVAILVLSYGLLTAAQNRFWRDPVTLYTRTLHYAPESLGAINNLAIVLTKHGKAELAREMLERARSLRPNNAEVAYNLGRVLSILGKNDEAFAAYQRTIALKPGHSKAHNNLGSEYLALGKYEEAEAAFRKALEINPDDAYAFYNLGNVKSFLGKSGEAAELFKRAIDIDPELTDAYFNLGNALSALGRYGEAVTAYRVVAARLPSNIALLNNLGNAYKMLGKTGEAFESYRKVIELNPRDAYGYNNLGNVCSMTGKDDEAIRYYKKALELDPRLVDVYYNLGILYSRVGRDTEAIILFKRVTELKEGYAAVYDALARSYCKTGDFEKAAAVCAIAIRLGFIPDADLLNFIETRRAASSQ